MCVYTEHHNNNKFEYVAIIHVKYFKYLDKKYLWVFRAKDLFDNDDSKPRASPPRPHHSKTQKYTPAFQLIYLINQ